MKLMDTDNNAAQIQRARSGREPIVLAASNGIPHSGTIGSRYLGPNAQPPFQPLKLAIARKNMATIVTTAQRSCAVATSRHDDKADHRKQEKRRCEKSPRYGEVEMPYNASREGSRKTPKREPFSVKRVLASMPVRNGEPKECH